MNEDRTPLKYRGWSRSIERVERRPKPGAGQHSFPPSIPTIRVDRRAMKGRTLDPVNVSGHVPKHLAVHPIPEKLPRELRVKPPWRRTGKARDQRGEPGTIFPPDTRYAFSDTSYPWSTCGRVSTAAGSGAGVMIGPRHLMTANHAVNWGPNNTAGWLKFTPLRFDTSEPFGSAWAQTIYWWRQVDGSDGLDSNEVAFDYVVCVLDRRLGDTTGWMGSKTYSPGWNTGAYWAHVGYPGDLGGGVRPVFHGDGAIDSTVGESAAGRASYRMMHRNDYSPGQSGGPCFGWWAGDGWPSVVGIYSMINWGGAGGDNGNGGGRALPELINYCRTVAP